MSYPLGVVLQLVPGTGGLDDAQREALEKLVWQRLKLHDAWSITHERQGADRVVFSYKEGPGLDRLPGLLEAPGRFRICRTADDAGGAVERIIAAGGLPGGVRRQGTSHELRSDTQRALLPALVELRKHVPAGVEVLAHHDPFLREGAWRSLLVQREGCIEVTRVEEAFRQFRPTPDGAPLPLLSIRLTADDAVRFHAMTEAAIGRHLALIIDDAPVVVPRIQDPIDTGRLTLSLGAGRSAAEQLVEMGRVSILLQSGRLPVGVRIVETKEWTEAPPPKE